ncbi:CoA transferase [Rhodococcus sp. B10]|uniref:CoA transferase n=1 Tax=Rhodococcus sp. B10 TaxID=2695876 RepID=UPI0016A898D1|nr:Formyl-CoA:oxalate CoA-transferase [Rhodococcus sp. B10]
MTVDDLIRSYDAALGIDSGASCFTVGDFGSMLSATLPVAELASGAVASFAAAVDRYRVAHGLPTSAWHLDPGRITASFSGDRMLRIDDAPVQGFAELSGFFRSADGWVRTHANYPHHRRALLAALGLPDDADRGVAASRIGELTGQDIEDRCAAASAVAVRVRTETEWARDAASVADSGPLIRTAAGSRSSGRRRSGVRSDATADAPMRGIRVLDMTRVIAGPVSTRALALLGADVLRVDPPQMPEIEWQHLENGQGKRSAFLDIRASDDAEVLRDLVATADVVVTGYRPGALEAFGLDVLPAGVVHGRVSAWGHGPWADRRGFDSIVQAATGISLVEGTSEKPGALPAQALDHASGYLLAAAVVDALTAQRSGNDALDVSVSLARTGAWLRGRRGRVTHPVASTLPGDETTVQHGSIRAARPALIEYCDYPSPARRFGFDEPAFR